MAGKFMSKYILCNKKFIFSSYLDMKLIKILKYLAK